MRFEFKLEVIVQTHCARIHVIALIIRQVLEHCAAQNKQVSHASNGRAE